jgi:hypothetical protein
MSTSPSPAEILFWIGAASIFWVCVFLIARAFVLWYWKINRMVQLLESIDNSLKQLPAVARGGQVQQRRAYP